MSATLHDVFRDREEDLVKEVYNQLRRSTAHNYTELEWETLLIRVETLVERFIASLDAGPRGFVDYLATIAVERIAEGFSVGEVLMALRLLEEKAWLLTVAEVPRDDQIDALARVTGTIGAAKDRLAEAYVEHMARQAAAPDDRG